MARNKIDRIGVTNYNTYGSKMTIVKYNDCDNIIVQFENGYTSKTKYITFTKGNVKNPYDKSVLKIGYVGEGDFKCSVNGIHTKIYNAWFNLLLRCYDEKLHIKFSTYKNCTVDEKWHCFQNFAIWYEDNYYEVKGQKMNLDKDILFKGNKVYSPETCMFVPQEINTLFIKCDKSRGDYPLGVCFDKETNNFSASCTINKKCKKLGRYSSVDKAFLSYKHCKENNIKIIANKYKSEIPNILYTAMINYKVEITD